jgi:F0F1-type ATP synthase epsilon subunit
LIDKARAQRAKESAEATLSRVPKEDEHYESARIALIRAITRISVADKSSSMS